MRLSRKSSIERLQKRQLSIKAEINAELRHPDGFDLVVGWLEKEYDIVKTEINRLRR